MYPEHSSHPDTPAPVPTGDAPPIGARRQRRLSRARRRIVTVLAVCALLAVPAIAGYQVGKDDGGSTNDAASTFVPDGRTTAPPEGGADTGTDQGSDTTPATADLGEVADDVDDVVVNLNTTVEGGGQAAGTGIVISGDGKVLTNNHVISGATAITVEFAATGATRPARVLGYSVLNDVAVIQVQNVSNLKAADLGSSGSLEIGEAIVALGNAGGTGGTPTIVPGTVTALEQEITASDADGSNAKRLEGLIELAADIRSGDSGGPVVDANGTVVGVTVAASVSNSFGFPGRSGAGEGYAIPIEDALAIAKRIISGDGGEGIRVGATRAVLGVQIQPTLTTQRTPGGGSPSATSGARVVGVEEGSGADDAGLVAGDTIVALEGEAITTTDDLTRALVQFDPGDSIEITVRAADGDLRTIEIDLGEGPPS